ncbi:hypothetical protein OPKNFCMD_0713 [Methylobacterium crusticola]|uniref:Mucin-associated surface protein n=1 Tax=Methylobacterium crusticola TaxID=1697972 RepID=A0ABQ4QRY3_9HYPH|nr:hypothetical protein [Methylobacterium crusticola]GJD47999.1 hypothetical protein OPKNFCMD_0713 [Methylobacterium crusticola]
MSSRIDHATVLTLLRRATEKVRASNARAAQAEARAAHLGREVGTVLARVEAALHGAAGERGEARRAAAEAEARVGAAEALLASERARARRLEERLGEVMGAAAEAREAQARAEARLEALEARLARARDALRDEAALEDVAHDAVAREAAGRDDDARGDAALPAADALVGSPSAALH